MPKTMPKVYKLPSNVEAERSVLGSMLIAPDAADVALGSLSEEDFSDADSRNKLVFRAMVELHKNGRPIDAQTVIDELIALKLDNAVTASYLFDLVSSIITPDNIDHYINMVHEQAVLRELLLKFKDIQEEYATGVSDIGSFIAKSNDSISAIASKRVVQGMKSAKEVAAEVTNKISEASKADHRGMTGVDTGYKKLNSYTHGWQKGDMIILAARPSVGKTALGMNFAFNAALHDHIPVGFFSLEMPAEKVMERLVACRSSVPNEKIQTGYLNNQDRVKISAAIEEIAKLEMYFDDTPNAKLGDIIAKATKLKKAHPNLGLIVIDYLGLIKYADKTNPNARQQEVSDISKSIKALARTLNIPVICLAQLNRDVDQSDSKVPVLSNLRDSGSIEQDADIVMLMYRSDYYADLGQKAKGKGWAKNKKEDAPSNEENKPTTPAQNENSMSDVKVLVAKNRNGSTGTVNLLFQRAYSRFDDPSPEYEEKMASMERGS
ncbi:MAG TPA: replicative DNA helicase [Firmicutes bacterium]|nr:replicative DNA helicase [Bacillota bacterium]